jgi:hypothetical protein
MSEQFTPAVETVAPETGKLTVGFGENGTATVGFFDLNELHTLTTSFDTSAKYGVLEPVPYDPGSLAVGSGIEHEIYPASDLTNPPPAPPVPTLPPTPASPFRVESAGPSQARAEKTRTTTKSSFDIFIFPFLQVKSPTPRTKSQVAKFELLDTGS